MNLEYQKVRNVKSPTKAHSTDAGIDFFIPDDLGDLEQYKLPKVDTYGYLIPSGLKLRVPEGYCLTFFNKSSRAVDGYKVGACVIDSGYRGEVMIHLIGSKHSPKLKMGDKVMQGLLMPVPQVELIETSIEDDTDRGTGGFGSTGSS